MTREQSVITLDANFRISLGQNMGPNMVHWLSGIVLRGSKEISQSGDLTTLSFRRFHCEYFETRKPVMTIY